MFVYMHTMVLIIGTLYCVDTLQPMINELELQQGLSGTGVVTTALGIHSIGLWLLNHSLGGA